MFPVLARRPRELGIGSEPAEPYSSMQVHASERICCLKRLEVEQVWRVAEVLVKESGDLDLRVLPTRLSS
jgi:hypothetical protein